MTDVLTRRQLEVVRTFVDAPGAKLAGERLGMRPGSVTHVLGRARERAGVDTTYQLVRDLAKRGEL